jgi:T5orf172 domain
MQKQYVYIFSNTERADIVKIGKTTVSPRKRAEDMSRGEGVIGKWIVECYIEVPNCDIAEKVLHYHFQNDHFEKEQFKLTLEKATIESILKMSDFFKIDELFVFVKNKDLISNALEKLLRKKKAFDTALKYEDEQPNRNKLIDKVKYFELEIKVLQSLKIDS